MTLTIWLNALMEYLDISSEDLSHKLGCTARAVDHWRKGQRMPSGKYLLMLLYLAPLGYRARLYDMGRELLLEVGGVGDD